MAIQVNCNLNGGVPELVPHVGERSTILKQQAGEGMTKIVDAKPRQSGVLDRG